MQAAGLRPRLSAITGGPGGLPVDENPALGSVVDLSGSLPAVGCLYVQHHEAAGKSCFQLKLV